MSDRISKLLTSYESHISIPWPKSKSAEERSIFLVYDKRDELKLRARIGEFELATTSHQHPWLALDLTHCFEHWMQNLDYKDAYFEQPEYLEGIIDSFSDDLVKLIRLKVIQELWERRIRQID